VLEETKSQEHKIKILGIIMSEVQGMVALLMGKGVSGWEVCVCGCV